MQQEADTSLSSAAMDYLSHFPQCVIHVAFRTTSNKILKFLKVFARGNFF